MKGASYSGIGVELSPQFLALSALPCGRFTKIVPSKGVRHLDRWFFSPELLRQKPGTRVEVLEEPWERNQIYAVLGGKAVPCFHGRAPGTWSYTHKGMLQAILAIEGAELRAQVRKRREKNLDQLVRRATTKQATLAGLTKTKRQEEKKTLPHSKGDLKPFRTNVRGDRT
jgi:hypothetical protein